MNSFLHSSYRPYVRRLTNIRLPSRRSLLGRLGFNLIFRMFRLIYLVYFQIKGSRVNKRRASKIVSRKYKFIFFMIPKVATSSFLSLFLREPAMNFDAFRSRDPLAKIFPDPHEFELYYKFAFVRNPWARVVSCYVDKIHNVNKINKVMIIAKYPGLRPGMPFAEFVQWLCCEGGRDEFADPHWKSQCELLADEFGAILLDYVGRLENLEEDMERICDQTCIPRLAMPHKNTKSNAFEGNSKGKKNRSYKEYYTDKTRDLIAERYKKDIEVFGYVF